MKKVLLLFSLITSLSFSANGSFNVTATIEQDMQFNVGTLQFGSIAQTTGTPKASINTPVFELTGTDGSTAKITMTSATGTTAGTPNNTNGTWTWTDITGGLGGTAELVIDVAGITSWNAVTLDLLSTMSGTLDTTAMTVGAFSETINLVAEYN